MGIVEASRRLRGARGAPRVRTGAVVHPRGVVRGRRAARVAGLEVAEDEPGPHVVEHAEECEALVVLRPDRVELCPRSELAPFEEGEPLDPLTPVSVLAEVPAGRGRRRRRGGRRSCGVRDRCSPRRCSSAPPRAPSTSPATTPWSASSSACRSVRSRRSSTCSPTCSPGWSWPGPPPTRPRPSPPIPAPATRSDRRPPRSCWPARPGIANGRAAVQILGGMGFTWDMLPHLFLKRSWVLEHLFGTASSHAALLGSALGQEVRQ